jgi:hypothetical protein
LSKPGALGEPQPVSSLEVKEIQDILRIDQQDTAVYPATM